MEATIAEDDLKEAKFMDTKKTLQALKNAKPDGAGATPCNNSKALDMRRPAPHNRHQPQSGFLAAPSSSSHKVVYRQQMTGTEKAIVATSSPVQSNVRARSRDKVLGFPATSSFSFNGGSKAPRGRTQSPPTSAVARTVSRETAKISGAPGGNRSVTVAVAGGAGSMRAPNGAGSVSLAVGQVEARTSRPKSAGTYSSDVRARPKSPGSFSLDLNRVFPMFVKDAVPAAKQLVSPASVKIEKPPMPTWMTEATASSPKTNLSGSTTSVGKCDTLATSLSDEPTAVPELFSASMDAVVKAMAAYSIDAQKQIEEFINRKMDAALQEVQSFVDKQKADLASAPPTCDVKQQSLIQCMDQLLDMQRQLDGHKDSAVEVLQIARATTTLVSDLRNDMEQLRTQITGTIHEGLREEVANFRCEVDTIMAAQVDKLDPVGVQAERKESRTTPSENSCPSVQLEAVLEEIGELRARTEQLAAGDAARAVKLAADLREANQRWVDKTSALQSCMEDSINAISVSICTMQSQIREWHESTYARRQMCDDASAATFCLPATAETMAAREAPVATPQKTIAALPALDEEESDCWREGPPALSPRILHGADETAPEVMLHRTQLTSLVDSVST